MNKKQVFTAIFIIILIIFSFYLSSISWVLQLIFSLMIYSLIFYFFHIIWKKIRKKETLKFIEFLKIFLYRISIFLVIITAIIWSFAIYQNRYSPAPMPKVTLSNWDKTIIFQSMSHIATKDFYKKVANNIKNAKKEDFVYFFEWVKSWTKENMEDFNEALWIKFDENLYKNFSKLYWVVHQNNDDFIWLVNNKDFNVDLNIDEIMSLYREIETDKEKDSSAPIDANKEIIETLSKLNERQLELLVYINKSILNFIIKSDWTRDLINNNFWNKELFKVILDKRNEKLVNEIIDSPHKKIFITYWLLHFEGVFELLKENDKNWKIIKEEFLYPIK